MTNNLVLIKDCLKNKRSAQLELYNLYAPTMLAVCYRYTKSLEDAEDVLQEGFIKVFKNLHQYRMDGDIAAWIRRIMVNCAITYLNKHNRYKKDMQLEDVALHPITEETPITTLQAKDLIELIRQLPSGYQTIFNLIAVEGFNHIDVSTLLNLNVNTVRSQYSRARAMLIKLIEQADNQLEKKMYERSI
ncbi:MAG: RNA polymerase sigma factor [Chitinophagaceae bacterium]|jgi:RNA polymerase sigma factor (sigma-70 family)